ncbi:hypothetical protein EST38_g1132 [Candolleomyces aberdarensis]|uniref:Amidohydrolase-related domain-containing protein n=1 Tax=Candolleomyces aberdarensis TaxID=2316362 RepID=A0A4Q2E061_9AGAR|nr:hypothetical protein EST38_g1132 [Candolleomyces aberdarensis]
MPVIDVHHHYFPPELQQSKLQTNQDIGWKTPPGHLPWSPELSLKAMDELGIDTSILSYPAIPLGTISEENRRAARARNEFASDICRKHPTRFGFFATLPFLDDIEGCLEEIAFALDNLNADGVSLASSYGQGQSARYIGDDAYDPIWRELNQRGAVVPNETFKAAAHLVVTGRKRQYPNVKIILAHMGGTVSSMAARTAVLSNYMGCTLSPEEILDDFKSFYFETALSAYGPALKAMEEFATPGHLLWGSDFPGQSDYYHNVLVPVLTSVWSRIDSR